MRTDLHSRITNLSYPHFSNVWDLLKCPYSPVMYPCMTISRCDIPALFKAKCKASLESSFNISYCYDYEMLFFFVSRQEFVDAYVNYVFSQSVQEWYDAFSTGFLKVCGGKVLELFQPSELRAMVVGSSNYNWQELEEVRMVTLRLCHPVQFIRARFLRKLKENKDFGRLYKSM